MGISKDKRLDMEQPEMPADEARAMALEWDDWLVRCKQYVESKMQTGCDIFKLTFDGDGWHITIKKSGAGWSVWRHRSIQGAPVAGVLAAALELEQVVVSLADEAFRLFDVHSKEVKSK